MAEIVFVLNDIEKQLAESLILKLESGNFPVRRKTTKTNDIHSEISYEYRSAKQEKMVQGLMLDCRYKLRYRDRSRIFFSAWDCKDVCSVFYDVITLVHVMLVGDCEVHQLYREFEVDLNVDRYVFLTGQIAGSFVDMTNYLNGIVEKRSYNSQYIFSLFEEPDVDVYDGLIEKLKAEGHSQVRILQAWIRGEILYYAIADGLVLRPGPQRILTAKEERDSIRKIFKATNGHLSRLIDLSPPETPDDDFKKKPE